MIDFKEISDGETWELFARDFLTELGFFIESSPDRGSDAGKDMLVTENLAGKLGRYRFKWLVSCKHNAVSGKAVNEDDEKNILERLESFAADGFIGFYSTVPSSALNSRLAQFRGGGKIKDYRIFDHKSIESHLIQVGYSVLLMRYFPQSYKIIRPLHLITHDYMPVECHICKKDLLKILYEVRYEGNIIFARPAVGHSTKTTPIETIYFVCKNPCYDLLMDRLRSRRERTTWNDISDVAIPMYFLRFVLSIMNQIRNEEIAFSDGAFEQLKTFIIAMSQKVLRETTPIEKERIETLVMLGPM